MGTGLRDQFETEPAVSRTATTLSATERSCVLRSGRCRGQTLIVDTESKKDVDDETIIDTNRRFRNYLQQVTGYTAKERAKKAKKMVD